jgi:O-antigen ligase
VESLILNTLIFILPFIILPFGSSFFEVPKVIIGEVLIALLLPYFSKINLTKQKTSLFSTILIALVFYAVTVSLFNIHPYTLFGNPYRMQGLYFLINLLILSFLSAKIKIKFTLLFINLIFLVFFISSFLFGMTEDSRIIGIFGEPNSLGAYLLFLWPIAFIINRNRLINFFIVLLTVLLIFFTGSRSILIGFVLQIFIIIASRKLTLSLTIVITLIMLGVSLILPFLENPGHYQNRQLIWETAIQAIFTKPIFGYGFGNSEYAIRSTAERIGSTVRFDYVDSAHNILLDWLLQGGIIGMGLFVTIFSLTLISLVKNQDKMKLLSFLGIFSAALFNPLSAAVIIPFWWLIGNSQNLNLSLSSVNKK